MAERFAAAELDQLFRKARTRNAWRPEAVPQSVIRELYDLLKWGPTSANLAPGRFLFLTTEAAKARIAPYLSTNNRAKSLTAPVVTVVAYDLAFAEHAPRLFPHAPAVKDELTAAENLAIAMRLSGMHVSPRQTRDALARFEVPDAFVKRLSQGQKRRAALARLCLSQEVPLWLLDEPFTALDRDGMEVLKALVQAHATRGGMVAYTTHQDPGMAATSSPFKALSMSARVSGMPYSWMKPPKRGPRLSPSSTS